MRSVLTAAGVLLSVLAALVFLLSTEWGTARVAQGFGRWAPGELETGRLRGALFGRLEIDGFSYRLGAQRIEIDRSVLDWTPEDLLIGLLHVRELTLSGLRYRGPAAAPRIDEAARKPLELPEIPLPLNVRLDRVRISGVEIATGDEVQVLQEVSASATIRERRLRLPLFELRAPPLQLSARGHVGLDAPYSPDLRISWSLDLADSGRFMGEGFVGGTLSHLDVDHQLLSPVSMSTLAEIGLEGGEPVVDAHGHWAEARWPLTGEAAYRSGAGGFTFSGTPSAYQLSIQGDFSGSAIPFAEASLHASGDKTHVEMPELSIRTLGGEVRGVGRISWENPGLAWDMKVKTTPLDAAFFLPDSPFEIAIEASLHGDATAAHLRILEARLLGGILQAEGDALWADELAWNLSVKAGALDFHPLIPAWRGTLDLESRMRGNATVAQIDQATLRTAGGRIDAQGQVAREEAPSWRLNVQAADMDPGTWLPEWPGRLRMDGIVSGVYSTTGLNSEVLVTDLSGKLRGYYIRSSGTFRIRDDVAELEDLRLHSGANQVVIHGLLSPLVDVTVKIDSQDLGGFWPDAAGSLTGNAEVRGPLENPRLKTRLSGQGLRFENHRIERVALDLVVDSEDAEASHLSASASGVNIKGVSIGQLDVHGMGNLQRHQVDLVVGVEGLDLTLSLAGALREVQWNGTLDRCAISSDNFGTWVLSEPAAVAAGRDGARLERTCFRHEEGAVCAGLEWSGEANLRGDADIRGLPLSLTAAWLPREFGVDGLLDGRFDVDMSAEKEDIRVALLPRDGRLSYQREGGETFTLPYHDARIQGEYRDGEGRADFSIGIASEAYVKGQVNAERAPVPGKTALSGHVEGLVPDISRVTGLIPHLADAAGALQITADLAGTINQPEMKGHAELSQARARVPQLGIELRDIGFSARSEDGRNIEFKGSAASGEGRVDLDGSVLLDADAGWPLRMRVRGNDFEASRLPELRAALSPDIGIELRNQTLSLIGELVVPSAAVEFKDLPPSAVAVSRDEIIEGGEDEPKTPAVDGSLTVNANVNVALGEKVSLKGFGLEAGLRGAVRTEAGPDRPTAGHGEISLHNGTYKAYGQNLKIEEGRLIFAGPLDDPGLSIRATRSTRDVVAGLKVSGTLKSPRTELFSEPAMEEADALSYLLTGRPLSGASASEGNLMSEAAFALGLKGAELVTQQIAQQIGLDELTVASEGTVEESTLLAGKYLTPDLYVRYVFGLFSQESKILLNYRIDDHWSVESYTGSAHGMEIQYTIQREKIIK